MATITLKNIPDPVYLSLKRLAAANHRSVNGEIIQMIEKATRNATLDPEQQLALARELRARTSGYLLDEAGISEIKNEGRP